MRASLCISMVLAALTASATATRAADPSQFLDWSTAGLPGRLHVPSTYVPGQKRPLILFLHGGGEHGTDNLAQINGNIDLLLEAAETHGGAFLYAPQSNSGAWASTATTPTTDIQRAVAMIDQAAQTYSIDRNRIYLTGLSSGGGGTWDALASYPGVFAAGVPICGNFGASVFQPTLVNKPIWAFHAQDDPVVSVTRSQQMTNAIVTAKGHAPFTFPPLAPHEGRLYADEPLRYMEGGSGGHGIWHAVYAYEPMRDWLFSQSLPEPAAGGIVAAAMLCLRRVRLPSAQATARSTAAKNVGFAGFVGYGWASYDETNFESDYFDAHQSPFANTYNNHNLP